MLPLLAILSAVVVLATLAWHGFSAQRPRAHISAHPSGQWAPEAELTGPPPREIRARNRLLVHRVWLYLSMLPLTFLLNPGRGDREGALIFLGLLGCLLAFCVQQELEWRDERRIVAYGAPVKGVIKSAGLSKVRGWYRGTGAMCLGEWSIEYEQNGRRLVSEDVGAWLPSVGDIVTVIVDPEDPERTVVYPRSNFRCVGLTA
jgi:hypothetical protein